MKKAVLSLIVVATFFAQKSVAQYRFNADQNQISVSDNNEEDVVNISSENENEFSINVAGFQITFLPKSQNAEVEEPATEQDNDEWQKDEYWEEFAKGIIKQNYEYDKYEEGSNRNRVHVSFMSSKWGYGPEMGLSILNNTDYGMYTPSVGDFLDLEQKKSIHLSIPLLSTELSFNKQETIGLSSGLLLICDNYTFSNKVSIAADANGIIQPYVVDINDYKKSKLATATLRVPVLLNFNIGCLAVSGGVYGELLLNSHTKVKFPKDKARITQLNTMRYGFYARIGIMESVYLYGELGQTALFKSGKGPETYPCSIGLGINW